MPRGVLALLLLLAGVAGVAGVRAETLVASLSTHRVAITSNYTGAEIVVFGAVERDQQTVARAAGYDIVVTVRGPRRMTVVREKEKAGFIWLNISRRRFPELPVYLVVQSTRPTEDIADEMQRLRFKIGLDAILADPARRNEPSEVKFRDALVRLKTEQGLFAENSRGVTFLTPTIFRAPIILPAIAPTGNYEVEVALFSDGVLLTRQSTSFEVIKTGFEQTTVELSRDHSLLYGASVGVLALLFGWLATIIFRRD
ncbi:TIGR02186 family protein [Chelatococcus sp. SYSU_G07232]|uniref:TIGR02186 family protein n=1 Tax=Chelatococcus albus TaxID=3047466 RepID=A0ABT7AF30_9HYPH|nr:TIGR02186 family protein [Chelatococcus sp. SYSU_G07232]MDJ1157983.1 TIGR02186 family protein [Chelatococcus sp. SYSU_G07232]